MFGGSSEEKEYRELEGGVKINEIAVIEVLQSRVFSFHSFMLTEFCH